jgi:hypothetical protein
VGRSEEQAARNETVFRDANEGIAARRAELGAIEGGTPFICECEEETCTALVYLTPEEYEAVRSEPYHFVIATGHATRGTEIVRTGDGWTCVAKDGVARRIASETDPRTTE